MPGDAGLLAVAGRGIGLGLPEGRFNVGVMKDSVQRSAFSVRKSEVESFEF
jgi:hypothetical protein